MPYKNDRQLPYRIKTTVNTAYRIKTTVNTAYRPKGTANTGYRPKSTGFFFWFSCFHLQHTTLLVLIFISFGYKSHVIHTPYDVLLWLVISQRMKYYVLHIYVLLSSHQIRLVCIYIRRNSVVHTCFDFGQNYSRGRVDLWPESTHAHTSATTTTTPTHSPAHITLTVVEQNNEPFRGKLQRC